MSEILHAYTDNVDTTHFWAGWENVHVAHALEQGCIDEGVKDFTPHPMPDSKIFWSDWIQFNNGIAAAKLEIHSKGVSL